MKRNEGFNLYNANKKQKLLEDIWGEDPEVEEFDRCVNHATQICSQSENFTRPEGNNTTIGPYNIFKPKSISTSTQFFVQPQNKNKSGSSHNNDMSTSSSSLNSLHTVVTKDAVSKDYADLVHKMQLFETQKKKFILECETKQGEISILRAQLKQSQKLIDTERMERLRVIQETQLKWDEKYNILIKELSGSKCELELKNLEVVNLREKLIELKKLCNSNISMSIIQDELNFSQFEYTKTKTMSINASELCKIPEQIKNEYDVMLHESQIISTFPLQDIIPQSIFENNFDNKSVLKLKRLCIDRNSIYKSNTFSTKQSSNPAINIDEIDLEAGKTMCLMYCDIQNLLTSTVEELNNSEIIVDLIWKIVSITQKSLLRLLIKMLHLKEQVNSDLIEHNMNNFYLENQEIYCRHNCIFSGTLWTDDEVEVDIRRYLAVLGSLCIHSELAYNYVIGKIKDKHSEDSLEYIHILKKSNEFKNDENNPWKFLNMLLKILTIIKNLGISEQFCGFISSILKLLSNLSQKESISHECYNLIFQIFNQIIFSRPNQAIMTYVCEFLKFWSPHKNFVMLLCNKTKQKNIHLKEGLLYFKEDVCTFRILATLIELCELNTAIASHVVQFLSNALSCNVNWMYHQDDQRCECLVEVYNLVISIMYRSIDEYSLKGPFITDQQEIQYFRNIFHVGLIFLDTLTVRIPELVVKCSRLYSQFLTITKYISCSQNKLNMSIVHEPALESLVTQLNTDNQKQCIESNLTNNIDDILL